ncbi:unnamed protein product [Urochloa decumbens]|uniref:RRM domain-containing protein n=1 Tax=Urochloa decumbens TaxID=240449 RepID=A0ABC9ARF5_9POAL
MNILNSAVAIRPATASASDWIGRIAMPATTLASSRWSDLLRDISRRLHVTGNYVRFHATRKPWRATLPPPSCRPAFLPLLLAPDDGTGYQMAHSIFSPNSGRQRHSSAAVDFEIPVGNRRWVVITNGAATSSWLLANSRESTTLVNPLSGSAVTTLPPLPDGIKQWVKHGAGVVSGDGTVFLYGVPPSQMQWHMPIWAALLRPGSSTWTPLKTTCYFDSPGRDMERYSVTYRHGKIILWDNSEGSWTILPTEDDEFESTDGDMPYELSKKFQCMYNVESRGELLVACIEIKADSKYYKDIDSFASALSVSVYSLQNKVQGNSKLQWVRMDSRSLADRVLFLGRPSSFAMDGMRLGMSGGCAYLVDRRPLYGGSWSKMAIERCRVFRYSFHDDTAELVEQLPAKWNCRSGMWFTPQPAIATTEEICDRLEHLNRKAGKPKQQFGADFRMYVGNLSRKVDSYQLRRFFSKHGNVADARVMWDRKTGHSRGFGFVTMATTVDVEPAVAIAKLHGQSLYGRPLRVKFADEELRSESH